MRHLKQILMSRIESILNLQQLYNDQNIVREEKTKLLSEHKKQQKIRCFKQYEILSNIASLTLNDTGVCEEVFTLYNDDFRKYNTKFTVDMKQNVRRMFCQFFGQHGFKNRSECLNAIMQNQSGSISPAMLLGWISEWQKKIFSEMLQKQTESIKTSRDKSKKNILPVSVTVGMEKKRLRDFQFSQGNFGDLTDIVVLNKTSLHAYFLQDLQNYYKLSGLQELDFTYLKLIRKKIRKEDILKPSNLKKAVENIIETSSNKQIQKSIKQYEEMYYQKFPKKTTQTKTNPVVLESRRRLFSLSPIKKRQKNMTETDDSIPSPSKLLSPKMAEFQFLKPQELQSKIKRLKLINHKYIRNNIEFPVKPRKSLQKTESRPKGISNNLSIPSILTKQLHISLDQSLKQLQFLRCESIHSKFNNKTQNINLFELSKNQCVIKNINKPENCQSANQYDDEKLKISKNFQLSDLKVSKKTIKKCLLQKAF